MNVSKKLIVSMQTSSYFSMILLNDGTCFESIYFFLYESAFNIRMLNLLRQNLPFKLFRYKTGHNNEYEINSIFKSETKPTRYFCHKFKPSSITIPTLLMKIKTITYRYCINYQDISRSLLQIFHSAIIKTVSFLLFCILATLLLLTSIIIFHYYSQYHISVLSPIIHYYPSNIFIIIKSVSNFKYVFLFIFDSKL